MAGLEVVLGVLARAGLHVQPGENEVAGLPGLQRPLPHLDREVTDLVLEVIPQHHDKPLALQRLHEIRKVIVGVLGGALGRDVIEPQSDGLDALRIEPRHLLEQPAGHVRTDRGDAVDTERYSSLQCSIGMPGLG